MYGLDGDRDALRRARLDSPVERSGERGERVAQIGLALVLARAREGLQVECACGHVLGSAAENWKDYAAARRVEGDALPRGIVVHADLELVQYLCPACGRQHSVEVQERGEPPLRDFRIEAV
jgi:acetone carboxylase gamma subunit